MPANIRFTWSNWGRGAGGGRGGGGPPPREWCKEWSSGLVRARARRPYRRWAGFALSIPALDIVEAGAGGGSIAWVNESGILRVGPTSAGAVPGPVCYGRGGKDPTITDANVALGYMNPLSIAGGSVPIDGAAAISSLENALCSRLNL